MKHLFIARHGNYGSDDRLNAEGVEQMDILGEKIRKIVGNKGSVYVVSSTAPRALDSTDVLKKWLGDDVEEIEYLWSGSDSPEASYYWDFDGRLDKVMNIVNERRTRADGLVVITHMEVARDFPEYFLKREFYREEMIERIEKGQAVYFDLISMKYKVIP